MDGNDELLTIQAKQMTLVSLGTKHQQRNPEEEAKEILSTFDMICDKLRTCRTANYNFIPDEFIDKMKDRQYQYTVFQILYDAGLQPVNYKDLVLDDKDSILRAMKEETDRTKIRTYTILFLSAWFPLLKHFKDCLLSV